MRSWFDAFRSQSAKPAALGELKMLHPRELSGGKSGAQAALFMPDKDAIVLKWNLLEEILKESEVRKARWQTAKSQRPEHDPLHVLRERGATHIAIRPRPETGELFGVMAYPYLGPTDSRGRVGDFQWLVRDRYIKDDFDIQEAFELLLRHFDDFPVNDGKTADSTITINLPDLAEWDKYFAAANALATTGFSQRTMDDLDDWVNVLVGRQHEPSIPDSRVLHGDPRFSNIMIDTRAGSHRVNLIDFGAGDPEGGGHVFRDLARFEVDLLLRTTPCRGSRTQEISERGRVLFGAAQAALSDDKRVKIAEKWRIARRNRFSRIDDTEVRELHAIFVAMELLRRLKWHSELHGDADSGATIAELFRAVSVLINSVPAQPK